MFDRGSAIRARLAAPLLLALAIVTTWFLLESLVYRSGAYFHLIEPDSNTGAVVSALLAAERHHRTHARNILVFGDSRVGEGFSALIAGGRDERFNFINLSVPGSSPRTWYYLLREIERRGIAFDAVLVGVTYRPSGGSLHQDWPLDPPHAARLVGLPDALAFPETFASNPMRRSARRTALLPALALQQDARALLRSPLARARKILRWRPVYLDAVRSYGGRDERMPDLAFAPDFRSVVDWGVATPTQRAQVDAHLGEVAAQPDSFAAANAAFMRRWIAAMAQITQAHEAHLILYPLPRGPYRGALDDDLELPPPLRKMATDRGMRLLRTDLLAELEAPQYFFDALHVNRVGRERTSEVVGREVRAILAEDKTR